MLFTYVGDKYAYEVEQSACQNLNLNRGFSRNHAFLMYGHLDTQIVSNEAVLYNKYLYPFVQESFFLGTKFLVPKKKEERLHVKMCTLTSVKVLDKNYKKNLGVI